MAQSRAMQVITGYLLDRAGQVNGTYPPEAFKTAFLACLIVMAGCLVLCTGFKKALSSRHITFSPP